MFSVLVAITRKYAPVVLPPGPQTHPFGRDSRYDPITSADEPTYRPQASPMQLRATDGYKSKEKLSDPELVNPRGMIFTDRMMQ